MPSVPATRTPGGAPARCPVCGARFEAEPAEPYGDTTCPKCGALVTWFRLPAVKVWLDLASAPDGLREILIASLKDAVDLDSLDLAEMVMDLEEDHDLRFDWRDVDD